MSATRVSISMFAMKSASPLKGHRRGEAQVLSSNILWTEWAVVVALVCLWAVILISLFSNIREDMDGSPLLEGSPLAPKSGILPYFFSTRWISVTTAISVVLRRLGSHQRADAPNN